MRIVVYGPERRVGAWEGDQVIDLARAYERYRGGGLTDGERLPSGLLPFIEAGQEGLEKARQAIAHASSGPRPEGVVFDRREVRLHAPWPGKRIACVGGNFADHLMGMIPGGPQTLEGAAREAREYGHWGFWKVPDEVVGPDGEIPYPSRTRYLDYEGEPGIVIGRRAKDISASSYRDLVWGVTLLNDGSLRDGMGTQQPRGISYNLAKNFDGSAAIGPCIAVDEIDPEDVPVETRVNGQVRQSFNSRDMIYGWGEVLEHLSRDFTLVPGDILSGGTGAGTAADQTAPGPDGSRSRDLFLKPGDTVEVASPRIGTLRVTIV
jgi:2-keto-4-pentenoate hydratase/2-oxohepta-3-ene-1,7-dioic acid hydratase in catechol pathway